MNKMTLTHIGIFLAGAAVGYLVAKNQSKDKIFANLIDTRGGTLGDLDDKCYRLELECNSNIPNKSMQRYYCQKAKECRAAQMYIQQSGGGTKI